MTQSVEMGECVIFNTISPLRKVEFEAVGVSVLHAAAHTRLTTQFERNCETGRASESSDDEENAEDQFEDDLDYLRSLDPKEWKEQDHYAVLGLRKLRYKATEDTIKRAYKQKILKHHPDKRKAMGEEIREDDDYFTCITRAWEMLGNPVKRRSYDSVDSHFSDDLPDEKDAKNNFYETMGRAFAENSRWSVKQPVPQLGDENTSRDKVERFYSFWYDFESWREYSYLDEEDKESGQDRDMRKWIEKKNKVTRAKRKKEEMGRIRSLVDTAYNADPRIRKFQREEKDRKTAAKRAKQEAAKARQLEEERLTREAAEKAREERERLEAEEKVRQDALKQERESLKKALKKERKVLRDLCKSKDYYAECAAETVRNMASVEKICELLKLVELEATIERLQAGGRDAFLEVVRDTEERMEAERRKIGNEERRPAADTPTPDKRTKARPWSEHDLQLLIKAVNLFPAGTNQRWDVVANFINQHANAANGLVARDAKEVLAKAKDLQSTDFSKSSLKERANKKAYDYFVADNSKSREIVEERMPAFTERLDDPIPNGAASNDPSAQTNQHQTNAAAAPAAASTASQPWTPAEQKLLEQALKTYSAPVADRWDQIAACIPTRTKKECMRRYKELVELVKAKKAAQVIKQQ